MMNVFDSVAFLEPKCGNCDEALHYGTNTRFDDDLQAHVCLHCGHAIG